MIGPRKLFTAAAIAALLIVVTQPGEAEPRFADDMATSGMHLTARVLVRR